MKCPKCNSEKLIDYGISGIGNPHKECLKCGYVGTRKEFKYGVKESKDVSNN